MLWFDLDNSPHVPLFRPIFRDLQSRGVGYTVTAREFAQTADLLSLWGIQHLMVGKHAGRSRLKKVVNLVQRAGALRSSLATVDVTAAISHGSRAQVVAAWRMRRPSIVMLDYEFTEAQIFNALGTRILMPSLIPGARLREAGFNLRKLVRYDGFKEEIYLASFKPEEGIRSQLGVDEEKILVTIRPPSTTGNYHDSRSEMLFRLSLEHFASTPNTHCLIVNRTRAESGLAPEHLLESGKATFLREAVDGLQLLWHSDIVLSGGGTMNREAALLGIPTFSIFSGKRSYLDEHLQGQGRLLFIDDPTQIESIPVAKRPPGATFSPRDPGMASYIVDLLMDLVNSL